MNIGNIIFWTKIENKITMPVSSISLNRLHISIVLCILYALSYNGPEKDIFQKLKEEERNERKRAAQELKEHRKNSKLLEAFRQRNLNLYLAGN